jgi:hypothetical protein
VSDRCGDGECAILKSGIFYPNNPLYICYGWPSCIVVYNHRSRYNKYKRLNIIIFALSLARARGKKNPRERVAAYGGGHALELTGRLEAKLGAEGHRLEHTAAG